MQHHKTNHYLGESIFIIHFLNHKLQLFNQYCALIGEDFSAPTSSHTVLGVKQCMCRETKALCFYCTVLRRH